MPTTRLSLPTAHGHLEALWDFPLKPKGHALVCHLHPGFGGNMHNNTTYRIAKAWTQAHISALRFNFRGVGNSTGGPAGESEALEDAHSALGFLQQQNPKLPLFISGFSFGARTALSLALREPHIKSVLAVGVGVDFFDMRFVTNLQKPVAFVHAEKDTFGKLENLQALALKVQAPNKLFLVPEAGHLFLGHMQSLEGQLKKAVSWLQETVEAA